MEQFYKNAERECFYTAKRNELGGVCRRQPMAVQPDRDLLGRFARSEKKKISPTDTVDGRKLSEMPQNDLIYRGKLGEMQHKRVRDQQASWYHALDRKLGGCLPPR